MSNYLTTQEVADRLGVSVFTIRRYVRSGKLKAVRLEGAYRVSREDLREFLQEREIGGETDGDAAHRDSPGGSSAANNP
jgi:excisionase family DNA binding protein